MTGRPSGFTQELADTICERIACGDSLAEICRTTDGLIYGTVIRWLREHESFRVNYTRAREEQGHADADAIGDIQRQVLRGLIDPQAARVAIDALKWTAGKRLPKVYGDKVTQEHTGADGAPLTVVVKQYPTAD